MEEYLTVSEVAQQVRVSTKTVYRWINSGCLAAHKFGPRSYRILKSSLDNFIRKSDFYIEEEFYSANKLIGSGENLRGGAK